MKYFLLLAALFVANFAASQNPDSIYVKKDTVSQNVLIFDAGDNSLLKSISPEKDMEYGGRYVYVKSQDRNIVSIRTDQVTKTIVGTDTTAFSGTSKQLLQLLQLSFFKPS